MKHKKIDFLLREARAEIERLDRCGSPSYADLVRRLVEALEKRIDDAR